MKYTYQTPACGHVKHPLPKGTTIISVEGENDIDEGGCTRHTGPIAAGDVCDWEDRGNGEWSYCVEFRNGTTVWIDSEELATQPYVVIVTKSDIPPPPASARDLAALATRMNDEIDHENDRTPTGDDFNDLCSHISLAALREAETIKRWNEALRCLIDAAERMDARLLKLTDSPFESEHGDIERARAILAEFKGFL